MREYELLLADDLGSCFSTSDPVVCEKIPLVFQDEMCCRREIIREAEDERLLD